MVVERVVIGVVVMATGYVYPQVIQQSDSIDLTGVVSPILKQLVLILILQTTLSDQVLFMIINKRLMLRPEIN